MKKSGLHSCAERFPVKRAARVAELEKAKWQVTARLDQALTVNVRVRAALAAPPRKKLGLRLQPAGSIVCAIGVPD